MSSEQPGPLTRILQLCAQAEKDLEVYSASHDNHVDSIYFVFGSFVGDIKQCANEIHEIISKTRSKMTKSSQEGCCKTE